MKKLIYVLLLSILQPALAQNSNGEGIKAYRSGDYVKAEQLYRQALTEETNKPALASIYRNLAVLYQSQNKDATEFSKKADELDPPPKPSPKPIEPSKPLAPSSTRSSPVLDSGLPQSSPEYKEIRKLSEEEFSTNRNQSETCTNFEIKGVNVFKKGSGKYLAMLSFIWWDYGPNTSKYNVRTGTNLNRTLGWMNYSIERNANGIPRITNRQANITDVHPEYEEPIRKYRDAQ